MQSRSNSASKTRNNFNENPLSPSHEEKNEIENLKQNLFTQLLSTVDEKLRASVMSQRSLFSTSTTFGIGRQSQMINASSPNSTFMNQRNNS